MFYNDPSEGSWQAVAKRHGAQEQVTPVLNFPPLCG